jgi:hypothetical protein
MPTPSLFPIFMKAQSGGGVGGIIIVEASDIQLDLDPTEVQLDLDQGPDLVLIDDGVTVVAIDDTLSLIEQDAIQPLTIDDEVTIT